VACAIALQSLTPRVAGSANNPITFQAETRGGVTFDMQFKSENAFVVLNKQWIVVDGFRFGQAQNMVFHSLYNSYLTVRNCGCWNAATTPETCNTTYSACADNIHCIEAAFSDHVLIEDCWGWGSWRYAAMVYQTTDSAIRRFACSGSVWGVSGRVLLLAVHADLVRALDAAACMCYIILQHSFSD
jgi:hypothetical protein